MVSMNQVIAAADRMAAMPATVLRVAAALASGTADPDEIAALVRSDEVLTAAVLRRANSVAFGAQGRTFDLRQSIARLGSNNLSRIVMEQRSSDLFASRGEAFGLRRGALWRSGIGGAVGAELIARRVEPALAEQAYVAGLLRDIGKVALEAHFGHEYLKHLESHTAPARTFTECERLALGFDHAAVGREMALHWGLPQRLAEAIGRHHEPAGPEDPAHDALADIVHAADAVCLWAGLAVGHDGLAYRVAPHISRTVGLTRREAEAEIAHVWTEVRAVEDSLNAPPAQEKTA